MINQKISISLTYIKYYKRCFNLEKKKKHPEDKHACTHIYLNSGI